MYLSLLVLSISGLLMLLSACGPREDPEKLEQARLQEERQSQLYKKYAARCYQMPELSPEEKVLACIESARLDKVPIYLGLSNLGINTLPDDLSGLEHIEILDISLNNLKSLPRSFRQLKGLKYLIASKNQFIALPPVIFEMDGLDSVAFPLNKITAIDNDINKMANLMHLSMGVNLLTSLPESLEGLTSLVALEVKANKFTHIPKGLYTLPKLQFLDISYSKADFALNNDIPENSPLKVIDLTSSGLKTLPESIANLRQLQYIQLQINNFTSLPKALASLPKLREPSDATYFEVMSFDFDFNSKSIAKFNRGRGLGVSSNDIVELDHEFCSFSNLDLSGNPLSNEKFDNFCQSHAEK
ncbi:MAG: hypothetical protein KTR16_01595 [Acidiferrobacterales bacterium]|nr:hypothetical protein [Acidiferrobacterales bacterium]